MDKTWITYRVQTLDTFSKLCDRQNMNKILSRFDVLGVFMSIQI